jgi:transposase InsO family protein
LLHIVEEASVAGWAAERICGLLGLDRRRLWRWQQRVTTGVSLADRPGGGNPVHGLLDWEVDAILALFEDWADIDVSHRKLAHRGSYEQRVWVSPSTVDRVLARHGLGLPGRKRPPTSKKKPWPDWCEWRPNQLWVWDGSQFEACEASRYAYGVIDLVSRRWVASHLTPEPSALAAKALFRRALTNEALLTDELAELLAAAEDDDDIQPADVAGDDEAVPLLLAISDNGTEMKASDTRRFLALCSIAQHFGRPSTPTDQAWIESLWGHVKGEHPHLMAITDPAVLAAELERVRKHYNGVRLHEGIGYVTPDDEHEGRGETIRKARRDGLERAAQARKTWHRAHRPNP